MIYLHTNKLTGKHTVRRNLTKLSKATKAPYWKAYRALKQALKENKPLIYEDSIHRVEEFTNNGTSG